jgi:hypothetical protein
MQNNRYSRLEEALDSLKAEGFSNRLISQENGFKCVETGETVAPEDLTIVSYYVITPDTSAVVDIMVYAVSWEPDRRGIIVDMHGPDADPQLAFNLGNCKIAVLPFRNVDYYS